ncbi:chromosome segregation protein SMC [Sulfuritalea sp.]|uniref:chromosome segregation protein SMC n=1 Tax=Sulfuritalea sp. TaxID=2480090 RepID=UPI001ACFC5FE|nr:chromosome segregation protein SMC [Sulfuritalea sp.]MBN8473849.1 chromosome segregation protein SMC [Sulfuritalea sp.]
MRLYKLKLSGFKSFVEPTTVLFPGQLAGVVGPNGCGKSNIIDAVRWVLGESKASELRGESIQDVIFKGSGNRKEVSRAAVELHFDNAAGRAAGQWSQYAEITVKRVLDREGNSSYYINNLHVRRRDVIDLFLGTGLGPRAYAIIGQGMISRIVEAKPEELRFFLEEAAGVTKYKERRRETEHRLEDARENIARVDDIRNELKKQVEHLQAQAAVAQQYRGLHEEMSRKQTLLWLKKRNDARSDGQRLSRQVEEAVTRVEAETAQLREIEARVEHSRESHYSASDALHAAQAEMHAATNEVGRLESELGHLRDSRSRLETRLAQLGAEQSHWSGQQATLAEDSARWNALLDNSRNRVAAAAARHEEAAARLPECEDAVQSAGGDVTEARRALSEAEQALRLAEADRGHAQRALENLAQRRGRLEQDKQALGAPDPAQLAASREAEARGAEALDVAQERLTELQSTVPGAEAALRAARESLQAAHRGLTESRARHDALAQLQAKVAKGGEIGDWLKARGLAEAKPLWQSIQVEAGWETAVEAVLRERFSALAADPETLRAALQSPPPAILTLAVTSALAAASAPMESLRAKVRCEDARWNGVLDEWLAEVSVSEDLAAGLPLATGCRVSRAGHLLTPAGLTLYVPDAKTHGVIERQREIDDLAAQLDARAEAEDIARARQQGAEQELAELQVQLTSARRALQEAQQALHAAQVEALKLAQAQARYEERSAQIDRDLAELQRQEEIEKARIGRADDEGELQRERLSAVRERVERAIDLHRQRDMALRDARAVETQLGRELQEAGFSERECLSKLDDNGRAAATASSQLQRIDAETAAARTEVAGISDTVLQEQLHAALDARGIKESALAERRNVLEAAAGELRNLDEQRLRLEQGLTPLRDKISDLRLKAQAAQLNEEQYRERLAEVRVVSEADEAPFLGELSAGGADRLKDSVLQGDIARLTAEIETLGPVNLAALEELATASERKSFLDAQSADLAEAIGTLEDAIRRIDRETREQLQETYNTVNLHFGNLFPQLFGGGEARLILTGDEILDAGIQIMAQPPGKKNTTIHLLSGGEKALTAIALVFAIFNLNPAPFCMLDEVDAPLDDSNTVRFCEMVKRMSVNTQFVFISHNKIAMEMAQQLIGVTMQEQGVSRVVEVDIEEALRLADEQKVA